MSFSYLIFYDSTSKTVSELHTARHSKTTKESVSKMLAVTLPTKHTHRITINLNLELFQLKAHYPYELALKKIYLLATVRLFCIKINFSKFLCPS